MRCFFSYSFFFIIAVCAVQVTAAAQQDNMDTVQIRTTALGGGIAMLTGRGGNLVVCVGDDGPFLVDDQFAPLTPKIKAAIAELSTMPVRFVLNTHWHRDHTSGNENMGKGGAIIVAQDNVRKRMSTEQFNAMFNAKIPPSPAAALPIVTFNEGVTFHLNGEEIRVMHIDSAHTDGDAVVHFMKGNVIHTGDTFFNGMYPVIDISSGGSIKGMIAASQIIIDVANEQTKIVPGHGPVGSIKELKEFRLMLMGILAKVQNFVNSGKTLEETIAAKPSKEFDAVWGNGFMKPDAFIEIVYKDLKRTQ